MNIASLRPRRAFFGADLGEQPVTRRRRRVNIQIQTTSICNGRCTICPYPDSWHKAHPGVMGEALFNRVLDELAPLRLAKVCPYLENEPLMDPLIFERIGAIKRRLTFDRLEVSTNALALDEDKARRLGSLLADVPHEIWVSFHGVDARTHDGIMGLGFERCLANVVGLLKLSDRLPLRVIIRGAGLPQSQELATGFAFTEEEYIRFWEGQLALHGIRKRPGINFIKYHDRAGTIRRNGVRLPRPARPDLTGFRCPRVGEWLHILYTGELIICCMDYHREEVFGDLSRDSLESILSGPVYANLRDRVEGRAPSSETFICKRCISPGG